MKGKELDFLLGAVGPSGFTGYFDQIQRPSPGQVTVLIKAGPGCGKSTLMKRVSKALVEQGCTVQHIHCSSDPASLDGVICEEKQFAIVDATAPHMLEPKVPVAVEEVLPLYHLLDRQSLRSHQTEIVELFGQCAALQARAARYIAAAGNLVQSNRRLAGCGLNRAKAEAYAHRLAARLMPARPGEAPQEQIRLLTAMTLEGRVFYRSTVQQLAGRVIALQDEWGAASQLILQVLRSEALERGYSPITCYCPMAPGEKTDHLLLPQLGLAVCTGNRWHPVEFAHQQNVHCRRFEEKEELKRHRVRMQFNQKTAEALIQQAASLQAEAKIKHDELEGYYRAAADFSKMDSIYQQVMELLA